MTLIGLGHRARVGKDTVGAYLVSKYGFHRVAFADVLKDVCTALSGLDAHEPAFKDSVAICGWSGGQLLQNVGVELRELDPDIWIQASRLEAICSVYKRVVVTDVRFLNEASFIHKLGGKLVKIWRKGLPNDRHVSETNADLASWDYVLMNDSTLEDLYARTDKLLSELDNEILPAI